MRRFHSYGPINKKRHYYVSRKELINQAIFNLVGEDPEEGGHYFTVWAPRQTGKTWIMREAIEKIKKQGKYEAVWTTVERLRGAENEKNILQGVVKILHEELKKELPMPERWEDFSLVFDKDIHKLPLILVIDEFDCLKPEAITNFVAQFREIYMRRDKYMLHGLALVGVRAVVGVDSMRGSPFNVQRSMHIPNLTKEEVKDMFKWYEKESGQKVEPEVIERLYYETQGQPGLIGWLGELLTETYNKDKTKPISIRHFERIYELARHALPNNTLMNLVIKAKHPDYKDFLLELFNTQERLLFSFHDDRINYLYMNGIISQEEVEEDDQFNTYIKFSSPMVQKVLFEALSQEIIKYRRYYIDPTDTLEDAIDEEKIILKNIIKRYASYIKREREAILKTAPCRQDGRMFEAIYHFHLYHFLQQTIGHRKNISIYPEFPTGNGKVDILIRYHKELYALEIKSFIDMYRYKEALAQAAQYANQLKIKEITLCIFIETDNKEFIKKIETEYIDKKTKIKVIPAIVPIRI